MILSRGRQSPAVPRPTDRRRQGAYLGGGASLAVLCLDLDGFKGVNDALGHSVGDDLLRAVAERIRGCLDDGDSFARLGGDEFAVLMPSPRSPDEPQQLASGSSR